MFNEHIKVVLFSQSKNDGSHPVKIRITERRKSRYINLGFSLFPHKRDWDEIKQKVKSNNPNYKLYNKIIEDELAKLTRVPIEEIMASKTNSKINTPIGDILKERIEFEKSNNHISTEKKTNTALQHLKGGKLDHIKFIDFNISTIKKFQSYLHSVGGIQESSMGSYHRVIRSTLKKHAKENEISHKEWSDPYLLFSTSRNYKLKFALKGRHVIQLEDYITFHPTKTGVEFISACMFVFSVYSCGMRYGDVFKLKWSNIKDKVLRYETEKNNRQIPIRLNPKLTNVLKYFTPLNEYYKNPNNCPSEVIQSIETWFPKIQNLIKIEEEYLEFRTRHKPIENELIDELFGEHITENVQFSNFDENAKKELELIYKTRDEYVLSFILTYADRTTDSMFPFFNNLETNFRKIVHRKESSNAAVNRALKIVAKDCKIPKIGFHEARHTFAYHARKTGFDLFQLSRALGHSSLTITQNYLNTFDNEEVMDKNDLLVEGLNDHYII
jgi:integrase